MMTEDIVVPSVVHGYSDISVQRVSPYLATGGAVSLINWPELSEPRCNMGGSFGAFLNRRFGIQLYRALIDCDSAVIPPSYGCMDTLIHSSVEAALLTNLRASP